MELKTPTKKGIKTPRYRPPLPMLNESYSGFCIDEYDWPQFTGYYNGTSVIVDDSQAMTLLTNKGFFGKGSLSRGCPNVTKRKIPISVIYESQWKRRKTWIQSLNSLLERKKSCNENSEGNVIGTENKNDESCNDVEIMEVDDDDSSSLQNNSGMTEEKPSKTSESEDSKNDSNETSKSNTVGIENIKGTDLEKKEVDNEKNDSSQNNSCKNEKNSSEISENKDSNVVHDSDKNEEIVIDPVQNCQNENSFKDNEQIDDKDDVKEDKDEAKENEDEAIEVKDDAKEDKDEVKENKDEAKEDKDETKEDKDEVKEDKDEAKEDKDEVKEDKKEDLTSCDIVSYQSKSVGKINLSNNAEKGILNINEVLVIPDIDGELEQYFLNLKPYIEEEKVKTAIEVLYLSLEEAFFLSYSCNCLQIYDLTSNILRIRDMWVLFIQSQPDFIEKYVAYHYFRAKGWVVKSGTKFGGDFLLYKKGPLFFHASYIVIVEVLKNDENSRNKTTWQKIVGMNRMAESANKEILICHVLWPDVEEEKFNDPKILKEFKVSETLLRRWQATQEKTITIDN